MSKKILIITDSEKLQKAVEINLQGQWLTLGLTLPGSFAPLPPLSEIQLIVLALASSYSEPIVMLAQTSLQNALGCIPLLVISDHPFPADQTRRIHHLNFPVTSEMLCHTVDEILAPLAPAVVE